MYMYIKSYSYRAGSRTLRKTQSSRTLVTSRQPLEGTFFYLCFEQTEVGTDLNIVIILWYTVNVCTSDS